MILGLAAVSTVALGVAGVLHDRAHSSELAELRAECDAALARADDTERRQDAYIAELERDTRALLARGEDYREREGQLQASRLELDASLREREAALAELGRRYRAELVAARAALDAAGERLAASERERRELEHARGELLDAYGERLLSGEGYRRAAEAEKLELSRTLAYEQWQKTVRIAVEGECQSTWGSRKFQRCARRVEALLRPREQGAIECIIGGYGLPFYAADQQQVQVFPENSAVLDRGVVVPCDRSLHDRNYGD